jgi:uncharacterized protein (TIGR03663 family)
MALICTNCSAENPRANRFCDTCGAKLPKEEATAPTAQVQPARKPEAKISRKARGEGEGELEAAYSDGASAASFSMDRNLLWLFLIIGVGAFLRLWELGLKPLHHDESIHAYYAFNLFKGEPYIYDPAYHGPFRYHFTALMFFIFGASDFTTRILPAGFGIFLIAFMWQWRSLLGNRGAMFTAALMAISPTWVYVSRFIRDDIFMASGSLLILWGLFKWFESRANRYLYWAVAGLALAFTSHEGTWIVMGIFGSFLMVRWLWETFANPVKEENQLSELFDSLKLLKSGSGSAQFLAAIFAPLTLLAGALGFADLRESRRTWLAILAIFFIPFTLLYSTFFTNMDGWFMGAFDSIAYWLGEQKVGRADQPWQFYIYTLSLYEMAIVIFSIIGGFRIFFGSGKPQYFWMKLVAFLPFVIAIYLLTEFPKNTHMVLPLSVLAVIGAGLAAYSTFAPEKGNFFKVFLIYWAMLGYIMFTIAGERMPWLTLHPLTPLTLLAGLWLGDFFSREKPFLAEHWIGWGVLWLPISFFVVMLPRQILQALVQMVHEVPSWFKEYLAGERHATIKHSGMAVNIWNNTFFTLVPVVLFIVLLVLTPLLMERWPRLKHWTRGIFVGLFALGMASLSHGTHNLIFHGDGADPREQLVYVQSTVEIVELTAKLDRMSRALTGGPYLKVAVEDTCSWPLSWYLRDMPNKQVGFAPPLQIDKTKDFPVVITGYENDQPNHDQIVAASFQKDYNAYPFRFRRWWGPDKAAFATGGFGQQLKKAWELYMYREPWSPVTPNQNPQFKDYVYPKGDTINSPYGSFDAVVWVRKDVDRYFQ